MKRLHILLALLFLLTLSSYGQKKKSSTASKPAMDTTQHYGKWEGKSGKENITFIFDRQGFATMIVGSESIGGARFKNKDGLFCELKYFFNYSGKPIKLDFIIYTAEGKELQRMKGLVQFTTGSKMRLALDTEGKGRPKDFSDKESIMELSLSQRF